VDRSNDRVYGAEHEPMPPPVEPIRHETIRHF
jgi:hypothetical protein